MNVNALAENFHMSRPAISQHIKILAECGLVSIHPIGRERYCEARLKKLGEVAQWVEKYSVFWNSKLDALEKFLDRHDTKPKRSTHEKKRRKSNP